MSQIQGSCVTTFLINSIFLFLQEFTTFLMTNAEEIHGAGYMWRVLEHHMPEVREEVEFLKLCNNRKVWLLVLFLMSFCCQLHN